MVLNVEIFIRCKCGHTITAREFLQIKVYLKPGEPTFVNAQFQCGNCRQIGEHHLVAEEILQQAGLAEDRGFMSEPSREDDDILIDLPGAVVEAPLERDDAITIDEMIDFHFQLERMTGGPPDG